MYYLCSEFKGPDQLCGYHAAVLRLRFHICKNKFSHDAAHNTYEILVPPNLFNVQAFEVCMGIKQFFFSGHGTVCLVLSVQKLRTHIGEMGDR